MTKFDPKAHCVLCSKRMKRIQCRLDSVVLIKRRAKEPDILIPGKIPEMTTEEPLGFEVTSMIGTKGFVCLDCASGAIVTFGRIK